MLSEQLLRSKISPPKTVHFCMFWLGTPSSFVTVPFTQPISITVTHPNPLSVDVIYAWYLESFYMYRRNATLQQQPPS